MADGRDEPVWRRPIQGRNHPAVTAVRRKLTQAGAGDAFLERLARVIRAYLRDRPDGDRRE